MATPATPAVTLQFNVVNPRHTRYIPTAEDLEEALRTEYGPGINFNVEVCSILLHDCPSDLRSTRGCIRRPGG